MQENSAAWHEHIHVGLPTIIIAQHMQAQRVMVSEPGEGLVTSVFWSELLAFIVVQRGLAHLKVAAVLMVVVD